MTNDMAVVMVSLFGRVDGEELTSGDPSVGVDNGRSEVPTRVVRRFFWEKALRSDANDGDTDGYRNPPGSIVVGTFFVLEIHVKSLTA
jgi:hypothetical protein